MEKLIKPKPFEKLTCSDNFMFANMDVDYLLKGHPYLKLKENIVIFICLDDLFKQGLPVYTFENVCRENNSVKLEDRTLKVFYNCSKWKDASKMV